MSGMEFPLILSGPRCARGLLGTIRFGGSVTCRTFYGMGRSHSVVLAYHARLRLCAIICDFLFVFHITPKKKGHDWTSSHALLRV